METKFPRPIVFLFFLHKHTHACLLFFFGSQCLSVAFSLLSFSPLLSFRTTIVTPWDAVNPAKREQSMGRMNPLDSWLFFRDPWYEGRAFRHRDVDWLPDIARFFCCFTLISVAVLCSCAWSYSQHYWTLSFGCVPSPVETPPDSVGSFPDVSEQRRERTLCIESMVRIRPQEQTFDHALSLRCIGSPHLAVMVLLWASEEKVEVSALGWRL